MANGSFESSKQNGPHYLIARFEGRWRGITKTYFEPGVIADESEWSGTIRSILDGMFMLHEYSGSIKGKPLSGAAFLGFNIALGVFESCWTDSFHNGTAMMFSKGPHGSDLFNVVGSYPAPDNSPPWGWRTTIRLIGPDTLNIQMFNITPEGTEALAVDTVYSRLP